MTEKQEEKEETQNKIAVCVCPQCAIPLFSDKWGIKGDQAIKCGVCNWGGTANDARAVPIEDWREYLFSTPTEDKEKEGLPPLPRNVFFMTAGEKISSLTPDLGAFLAKWGVLSVEDLQQPWIVEVFRRAGWAFFSTIAASLKDPPKIKEVQKPEEQKEEEEQLDLPLGDKKETEK